MRKFSEKNEMLMVLLFELLRTNNLTGQFMNPPEKPLLKAANNVHYMEDNYIVQSLRKSSEEIRKKPSDESDKQTTPIKTVKHDDGKSKKNDSPGLSLVDGNDKGMENMQVYDYEKCVNVIS